MPEPVIPSDSSTPPGPDSPSNFIEQMVEADNQNLRWGTDPSGRPLVHTRFPPEPNGYLHLGHAKSICLNYGLAEKFGGAFNLRFDDTNPSKEEVEYVESIQRDVKWLGAAYDTGPHAGGLFFASNYFDEMYEFAKELILKGKAYVCQLTGDEVSKHRGTPTTPATSPHRDRTPEESMKLFREMKLGKHPNGAMTLRAKIDLASPNFNLRDPVMYRIVHEAHHNTGTKWCLYPMYDWAHGIEDSLEKITHSICTLEFENHRPLYDWFINAINEGRTPDGSGAWGTVIHHSQQIEFAKLIPTYTILSKRNLLKMVNDGVVKGWDDPRMPTIAGIRRRGYPSEALRAFCSEIGVTKADSLIDIGRLENAVRTHLNSHAPRTMAVLRPLKVTIENWPEGHTEELDFATLPVSPGSPPPIGAATRKVLFGKTIYIEQEDFMEVPAKKFFRLAPGQEVRLRWAYFIKCTGVVKDEAGNVIEVKATFDPATKGGDAPTGPDGNPTRKVKGTLHWISAAHAVKAQVRLFDRLFTVEEPGKRTGNWADDLNPHSLETIDAWADPVHLTDRPGSTVQFERLGYFTVDSDSSPGQLVFNRTVGLKDAWAKEAGK